MSAVADARMSELDRITDEVAPAGLASELFAIVDSIDAQPSLKRAFTDPTTPEAARESLAGALYDGKVSSGAMKVLREAVQLRWNSGATLVAALERQGVRAELRSALASGSLDNTEEQLFRFGRTVDANHELRAALGNRMAALEGRQQIVTDLLKGKATPSALLLARRAVKARERTFDLTVTSYLALAAALRQQTIAQVTVARPLDDQQAARLKAALTRQLGRSITLQVVVDPAVIGGVRVQVGDEVIEGTVADRLAEARRNLT